MLADLLGIRWPIIQAPMAGAQGSALAIGVCKTGGLGSLPAALLSPEALKAELTAIVDQTDRPFNANFFCHQEPAPDEAREANWQAALAPYYRELGVQAPTSKGGRAAFNDAIADVIEPFAPKVVSFHFGLPTERLVRRARSWGAKILSTATTVEEGLFLEARGVDVIIAQGLEAGGHRGHFLSDDLSRQLGTFALLPQLVKAVKVPVVAAGGIADAAGIHAAMALGAAGVQLGTVFLLCNEALTSAVHRAALQHPMHTALTNLFSGRPARGIVNRLMRELGPMSGLAPEFPLATAALCPLRAESERRGSGDFSPLWSGQNASGCKEIAAADLVRELAAGLRLSLPPLR